MFTVTPIEHSAGFGAFVSSIDLNALSDGDFSKLQTALYRYKLLVVKDQPGLTPQKQFELNLRFDPDSPGRHADTARDKKMASAIPSSTFMTDIPEAPEVRVVGKGLVPKGHYGTKEDQVLPGGSHVKFHEKPLTAEELASGDTRLWRWHIDAPLYPKAANTARVTTLWAHTLPVGPDLNVRFDDGTGRVIKATPGTTAFIECVKLHEAMTPEQKSLVANSLVEYAPQPYLWTSRCTGRNDGFTLLSEGKELSLEDMPAADPNEAQILPMLWPNAMTGEKAFMVHALAARKLHLKTSPDSKVEIVDDIAKVRQILDDLQRPFLKEENIIFSPYKEGDLAIWLNRSCRHTAVEFPSTYGSRIMHQCHLLASDPVGNPTPIPEVDI